MLDIWGDNSEARKERPSNMRIRRIVPKEVNLDTIFQAALWCQVLKHGSSNLEWRLSEPILKPVQTGFVDA
jgi:hypothetical protein